MRVGELKILSTPHPCDQRPVSSATAPASAIRWAKSPPALRIPENHAPRASSRLARILSTVSGVAWSSHDWSSLQVGSGNDIATALPATDGSQASNSSRDPTWGSSTTSASTGPSVPGLQASIIPSSERTRGAMRSMWL